jgi:hypothetical protein
LRKGKTQVITHPEINFAKQIDTWVFNQLSKNHVDFCSLVSSLPGIYPTEVLHSLERLVASRRIDSKIPLHILRDSKKKSFSLRVRKKIHSPPPHPLDFEWRFTDDTVIKLAKYCLSLSEPGDTIGLLGVPSIYRLVFNNKLNRRFVLFDKNPIDDNKCGSFNASIHCDLRHYRMHYNSIAKIVLMDSPWYPEYNRAFLYNASKFCQKNGLILIVTPKEGTRPKIKEEWKDLLKFSKRNGLKYLGIISEDIAYDTPYFEKNSLKAAGILNILQTWRTANLAVFEKTNERIIQPPILIQPYDWYKESYFGIRVRKNKELKIFFDPRLTPIIQGDILPSISRRDSRRELADVWTHGNRIFKCKGTNVLHKILLAKKRLETPEYPIESMIERPLNKRERRMVSIANSQIDDIVKLENEEQWIL